MPLKRSSLHSSRGFTLIELMVASALGVMLVGLSLAAMTANRRLYKYDTVRTRINQNLRSALDIMGSDIREAGENLVSTFPAIELVDGASGSPDELYIRRNLVDEVLKVCSALSHSVSDTQVFFGDAASAVSGCPYSSNTQNYTAFRNYRTSKGGNVAAYIYNSATHLGEFFKYINDVDSGTKYNLVADDGTWANDYSVNAGAVYLIEEWHYVLKDNVLQLSVNGDTTNTMNVVFNVSDMQIELLLQDGTVKNTMVKGDDWTQVSHVKITLTGSDTAFGRPLTRTVSAQFFPRNILSH